MIQSNPQSGVWNCSPSEYFATVERVSNSMLNLWRQSRQRYYRRFVARTELAPMPTDAMVKGTLLHLLKLEPHRWDGEFVHVPECAPDGKKWLRRKDSDHERWWDWFEWATRGKLRADDAMVVSVRGMADALMANAFTRHLLHEREGWNEQSIRWNDTASGLQLKCRIDRVLPNVLIDIKTTNDASSKGFAEKVARLGYHRQAEWYMRGWEALTGERLPFVFIAVCSDPPHDVGIYELDAQAVELGQNQNRSALQQLAACYRNDDWREPWQMRLTQLSLPKWAVYADEYEVLE